MINTRKLCALLFFTITYNTLVCATETSAKHHLDIALPSIDSKKKKSRMRQSTGPKIKKIKSFRDMDYDQLLAAKDMLIEQKNTTSAIKYLEQLIKLCGPDDTMKISNHRLEIADLIFSEENYTIKFL